MHRLIFFIFELTNQAGIRHVSLSFDANAAWRQEGILRRDVRPDDTWNRCCIRF